MTDLFRRGPNNAAVSRLPPAMPMTRNFGSGWLSAGRRPGNVLDKAISIDAGKSIALTGKDKCNRRRFNKDCSDERQEGAP